MRLKFLLYSINILAVAILVITATYYFWPKSAEVVFVNEQIIFENKLTIPPLLQPHIESGEKIFTLNIQQGQTEFFPGKPANTYGYNGNILGPTIRASQGDKVRFEIKNDINEDTTVHWHGMELPAIMDGGPHTIIEASDTWQPNWTITNQAATLWYHPHTPEQTGPQVYKGLAGFFIIDDKNSEKLALPKKYGIDDIPLVIQDRKFDTDGQLVYDHEHAAHAGKTTGGMLGDTILVNGTHAPFIELPRSEVRLRLLNGSNARHYNFGFSDNRTFKQIASDGGFLEQAVQRNRLILAPGERAEIVVDLSMTNNPITLLSYPILHASNPLERLFNVSITGKTDENEQFKILEIRPNGTPVVQLKNNNSIILNQIQRLNPETASQHRMFYLNASAINNQKLDHNHADTIVKKGSTEIWTIRNESPIYHPFHIHGVQFQILERVGNKLPDNEQGWKDTVLINPGETIKLIIPFTQLTDSTTPFMYHCHILEHEDMGMMGQLLIVDDPETTSDQIPYTDSKNMNHQMH